MFTKGVKELGGNQFLIEPYVRGDLENLGDNYVTGSLPGISNESTVGTGLANYQLGSEQVPERMSAAKIVFRVLKEGGYENEGMTKLVLVTNVEKIRAALDACLASENDRTLDHTTER